MLIGQINAGLPINRINSVAIAGYATTFCAKQILQNSAAIELTFANNATIEREKESFHAKSGWFRQQLRARPHDICARAITLIVITMHRKCYNRWRALYDSSNSAYHLVSGTRI
jgi:hypothetical protein